MGTRVLGLDIGHSAIKGVVLDVSFRNWEVLDAFVAPVRRNAASTGADHDTPAQGSTPVDSDSAVGGDQDREAGVSGREEGDDAEPPALDEPTLATLALLAAQGRLQAESIFTNLSLDEVFLTRTTLPFAGAREVEAVIRPQLEGRLPADIDELHIDFSVCGPAPNGENLLYAVAVQPERMGAWLAALDSVGLDPRGVDVAPFPLQTVAAAWTPPAGEAVAWIDIGAHRTGVLVTRDTHAEFAREFIGGGALVTSALAEAFGLALADAEEGKRREARILNAVMPPGEAPAPEAVEISETCRAAVQPLLKQIRRSLQAHASKAASPASRVVLCGGGASLQGLAELVEQQLGVPCETWTPTGPAATPTVQTHGHQLAQALGLALRGVQGLAGSRFNLRRDDFAYTGSYEWLLGRLPALAVAGALIVLATMLLLAGTWTQLQAERRHLDNALEATSTEVFGAPLLVPERIQQRLSQGGGGLQFMPTVSAYDLFLGISSMVGELQSEGTVLEARSVEVDLSRRLFDVRGTAESADAVDRLETALGAHPCLRNLQRQSLQASRDGDGFDFGITGAAGCTRPDDEER